MARNGFDRLLWCGLAVTLVSLALFLFWGGEEQRREDGLNRALERELAYQARTALLQKLYGEVELLRQKGSGQEALLRLDELARRYPGEAHGFVLKGEILYAMGAVEEAVASFAEGVRRSGDYVDARSPLSRRAEIRQLVDEGLSSLGPRLRSQPGNRSLETTLHNLYYLQSRLAGGCE